MFRRCFKELFAMIVSTVWWQLQSIKKIDENWKIVHFLFENKIWVGTSLGVLSIIVILYDAIKTDKRHLKTHCYDIMKYITEKHFITEDNSVRCTIFRRIGGKRLYFHLIWKLLVKKFFFNLIHKKFKESYRRINQLVPDKSLGYLSIYKRYQHAKTDDSYIAFPITSKSQEYGSVTELCYKKGDVQEIHTVDISKISLPSTESELRRGDKGKVKTYMDEAYINDYATLLKMSTVANHIIAVPIVLEDETIWGIMTIDYIGDDNVLELDDKLADLLRSYSKMISLNIKHQ